MQKRFFRYSLANWCYSLFGAKFDLTGLCTVAHDLDVALDLVPHADWTQVYDSGVALSGVLPDMGVTGPDDQPMAPFIPSFNNPEHVERTYAALDTALDRAHEAGVKFVLVFTGFDTGEERDAQLKRIVDGYMLIRGSAPESLIDKAERLGITFVIEMLNTKGDEATWKGHPGYLGNDTIELVNYVVRAIGSPNFKLALDIYHIVMMGEDPFEMIAKYHDVIGVVHVAGVMLQAEGHHPANRGELTLDGQVVDYAAVGAALAQHVPEGTFVLLEYIPTQSGAAEVIEELSTAIELLESQIAVAAT